MPIKPERPAGSPLFWHPSGQWCKKIRGKHCYFGQVHADALAKYNAEKQDLHAGRTPRGTAGELTVRSLCGRFLTTKRALLEAGELSQQTLLAYSTRCQELGKVFRSRFVSDLGPDDFQKLRNSWAKRGWGPKTIANAVNRVRVIFNYAMKNGLLTKPIIYGEGFKRPSAKTLRLHRASRGVQMFEPAEIHRMIAAASQPLRTMILLGVNCGFGNADCGNLPLRALDLDRGWVNFPRPKTGIDRRCPLWPETVQTLRDWLTVRPEPASDKSEGLVFITRFGAPWHKDSTESPISREAARLLKTLGITGHRNFYALRHTFETIAGESRDQVAVDFVMGHVPRASDMSAAYRERISDARLQAVVDGVRAWLFGSK